MTVSYNFNASAQDKRSLVYGELPIDPGSGRVLFHAQDVPLYPTDEMMSSLFNYNNFSGTKPLPPLVLNAIPNISDAPFKLKGSKQEETSVWLDKNGNKTEIVEQNPKSEWSYDLVLDKGNNDLKFSSKIFELESDHNDYSLAYHVKKPVIENESPVNSSTLVLTGTKGKNTSVELLEKKANQSPGNGNDADGSTFSFFDNSILNGEIVKNDGSEVDNLQSVFNNEDISIYADGNNLFTAHTYLVTAMDLSDESGYANWQDPNTPEQNQIAVDLRTGRFKFRQDNLPSGTLTVKYSYFKKISDNGDALVWNYNYGNLTAGDNSITVRSADKMGNVSEPVNKILKYASDRIGTDLINYEYFANEPDGIENDVKITINKDINSYLNGFTYQMTREQNKAALSTFDNPNIMVGDQTICFITNIADSPYLTLHIKGTGQELITHKKILSKQLTSLVPFIDDFNSGDSLKKQGTYTKVPNGTSSGWSVDASSGTLKSSAATLDKLFVPQNTPTWQDYQFTIYVKRLNSSPINLSLLYKVTDLNNYYEFKLDETQNKSENYTVTENAPSAIPNTVNNGVAWSKFDSSFVPVKVEVRNHKPSGNTYVKTFIDDRQVNYFIYNMPLYGGIGIKADHTQIAVDKLEIKPLK